MADDGILGDIIMLGGLAAVGTAAYIYRDDIIYWLKHNNLWPFDPGCGNKTCPAGQHLNANCDCVVGQVCNGKKCPTGQTLNTATCVCQTVGTPGGNITFTAAGDWGSGRNSNWQSVVNTMKGFNPDAVVCPGDFSYTNPAGFRKVVDALHAFPKRPQVFGANGNHDGGSYASLFNAYSNSVRTVGNTSFMMLDTENGSGSTSYARSNFNKMTGKWKVVLFHKCSRSPSSDHGTDGGLKSLVPDFERVGIHLVLQGHNHIYARYQKAGGVTYVVVGTGGEGAYSIGSNCSGCPPMVKAWNSGFGTFYATTSNSGISCGFKSTKGSIIDSFTI